MNVVNAITMQDKTSSVLRSVIRAVDSTVSAMERLNGTGSSPALRSAMTFIKSDLNAANRQLDNFNTEMTETVRNVNNVHSGLLKWGAGLGGALYVAKNMLSAIGSITDKVDEMTSMTARLDLINDGSQSTSELQKIIFAAAQDSRGSYMDVGAAVAKMGMLAGESFGSNKELIDFTNLMQKSFKLSGASTQEQSAAMYQLTQAMAAGKLQGDEFRSIMENAPMLAQAIADYTGKSKGELKELSSEGEITAEIIKNAMFAAGEDIEEKFASLPMTFGDVANSFKNQVLYGLQPVFSKLGQLANSEKFQAFTQGLANGIVIIAGALVNVLDLISSIASFFVNNWSFIAPIIWGIVGALLIYNTVGLITKSILAVQAFMHGVSGAAKAMEAGATFAATAAQWGLNAALLACPITWIIIAIIALIAIVYIVIAAINKFAGTSISATGVICGAFAVVGAFIWNLFASVGNFVIDIFCTLWNFMAAFANFFANLFVDPVGAVARLFFDLVDGILGLLQTLASALDTIFGGGVADTVQGWRNSLSGWVDDTIGKQEIEAVSKVNASDYHIDRKAYSGAWDTGYNFGSNLSIMDWLKNLTGDSDVSEIGNYTVDSVGTVGTVEKINDEIDISDESLKYLVDGIMRTYINKVNLQTVQPSFSIEFTGDINENADADKVAETIIAKAKEEMYASSDLTYNF